MSLGLLCGGKDTRGFDDVVCAGVLPWDVTGVLLSVEFDLLAIYDKVRTLNFDGTFELTMLRVVLEHVCLVRRAVTSATISEPDGSMTVEQLGRSLLRSEAR